MLGWWQNYENKQLDGDRYGNIESKHPFANSLISIVSLLVMVLVKAVCPNAVVISKLAVAA